MDITTLNFTTELQQIEELNPSFAGGQMRICYHGKNRNGSIIPKETLEAAIPTMPGVPVVANYIRKTDSIGSHDSELVVKDGKLALVNATQPVGVISPNFQYKWETYEDENGEHEYLVVPIILWRRQEACEHILKEGHIAESMEVIFDETHLDDEGNTVVDKLTFEAFCLLESAQPCFEGAAIDMLDSFQQQFSLMASEWKELSGDETFSLSIKTQGELDMEGQEQNPVNAENNFTTEPDNTAAPEGEGNKTTTTDPAPIENTQTEEGGGDGEPAGDTTGDPDPDPQTDPATDPDPAPAKAEFATYETKRQRICQALNSPSQNESWYLMDFDDEYIFVERYRYSDDQCICDYLRLAYAFDCDEVKFNGEPVNIYKQWLTAEECEAVEMERKRCHDLEGWYNTYVAEQADNLAAAFDEVKDCEGFAELIEDVKSQKVAIDDAKDKLFMLKGKRAFALESQQKETQHIVIGIDNDTAKKNINTRYGSFFD